MKEYTCTLHIRETYQVVIEAESEDDLKKKLESESEIIFLTSHEMPESIDLDLCVIDEVLEGVSES